MAQKSKYSITDYDLSIASAFIAGGIIIPVIAMLLLLLGVIIKGGGDIGTLLPFSLGVLTAGLVFLIIGLVKRKKYKDKLEEFENYKHFSKKYKAKIVSVNDGMPRPQNGNAKRGASPVAVAVCTAVDEETGETKYFYSHKVMAKENIKDKTVDIYVYPTGGYRVDFSSVRKDMPEGAAVRDFRK